jgi:hypothetical protein
VKASTGKDETVKGATKKERPNKRRDRYEEARSHRIRFHRIRFRRTFLPVSQKKAKGEPEFGCSVASFYTSLILILIKKSEPHYWLVSNKEQTKYLVVNAQI